MAQIGSFVPAKSATLGMLDAVYTRYIPNESQRAQCVHLFYLESIVYIEWGPATGCLQERAHSWLN